MLFPELNLTDFDVDSYRTAFESLYKAAVARTLRVQLTAINVTGITWGQQGLNGRTDSKPMPRNLTGSVESTPRSTPRSLLAEVRSSH
jgi:hypothetical protein